MNLSGVINNVYSVFRFRVDKSVIPPGSSTATLTLTLSSSQIHDTTNFLRYEILQHNGGDWHLGARSGLWQGNTAGTPPPSLLWQFKTPPEEIEVVVVNGANGPPSATVINSVDITFA